MAQRVPIGLGTLGGGASRPTVINEAGQVVGWSEIVVGSSQTHAFVWTPRGGMMDLGTLLPPGTSYAQAINNLGHVAVVGPPAPSSFGGLVGAYLWTPDGGMVSVDQHRNASVATAVNDVGQVGTTEALSHSEAFMWTATRGMHRLVGWAPVFPTGSST